MSESSQITISLDVSGYELDKRRLRQVISKTLAALDLQEYELSVTFTGSLEIKRLNREFRGIDKATDVLSFPQMNFETPRQLAVTSRTLKRGGAPETLGDIVISLPEAEANAHKIGQSLDREVCFLLVHGILHLCGHDHEEREEELLMLEAQRILMARLEGKNAPLWLGGVSARGERTSR